ncbi:MAG: substrate-binding domain-containing protein [Kineosporiaceae bacterium]
MRSRAGRAVAAAVGAGVLGTAAACTLTPGRDAGGTPGEAGPIVLAVADNTAFTRDVAAGARSVAAEAGVEVVVVDAAADPDLQAEQLQIAAEMRSAAVIVNAVDVGDPAARAAPVAEAGIPIVALDTALPGVPLASYVTSDNVDGGRQAAQRLARLVGYDGLIVHLEGTPATNVSRERGQGFDEGLRDFPGVVVAARVTADFDRDVALSVMSDLLAANPRIVGVFAESDPMALGAVEALRDRAGDDVQVVGYGADGPGVGAVRTGTVAATIDVRAEELGEVAMRQAVAAAAGEPVGDVVAVPVTLVDREDLSQPGR